VIRWLRTFQTGEDCWLSVQDILADRFWLRRFAAAKKKLWEKSPEHIAGHKAKPKAEKPEYIIDSSHDLYYVKG
jgi:hypothetical protein